ncbi:hypothetical protein [Streptomyces gulbargensis]|uniref:hypothetical protein n=1 Tax=Streptomyces gulbargensis TaxID=364901 RepID=UPI0031EB3083
MHASAAAERNYQAWICAKDSRGKNFSHANVAGYNQHGRWVRTPTFALSADYGDGSAYTIHCGQKNAWWFKPNQRLQINIYNTRGDRWERHYRNFKTQCPLVDRSTRGCNIYFSR